MKKEEGISNQSIALTIFFCLLPLQWIPLLSVAGLQAKIAHLSLVIPIIAVSSNISRYGGNIKSLLPLFIIIVCPLSSLAISLVWSSQSWDGATYIIRTLSYAVFSIVLAAWLLRFRTMEIVRCARLGTVAGVLAFLLISVLSLLSIQVNPFLLIYQAAITGDHTLIQHDIFRRLFSETPMVLWGTAEGSGQSSATRHAVMIGLLIPPLIGALIPVARENVSAYFRVSAGIVLFLALISLSRTVVIIVILGLIVVISFVISKYRVGIAQYLLWCLASILSVCILLVTPAGEGVLEIFQLKFVDDIIDNPRVRSLGPALNAIAERPILGHGAGVKVDDYLHSGEYIHNIILHYWHQAGLLGLTLASVSLFVVGIWFFKCVTLSWSISDRSWASLFAVGGILLIPYLVRTQFAIAGSVSLGEWSALALGAALSIKGWRGARGGSYIMKS